ncbi:MAG TPA: FKBP-type peptidyl-prolyl cis-trans isomerase [Actinomycetaceae bacterium]|nr:FKBP-type peptidyl-prolyl cis-trans isomerase [Actinomycetaceae bacterium]
MSRLPALGRRIAATATAATLALTAACGPARDKPSGEITVSGKFGTVPVVVFATPLPMEESDVETLSVGDGAQIGEADPVVLSMSAFRGSDGTLADGAAVPHVLFATEADLGEPLHSAIVGLSEGSRLIVTQPVNGQGVEMVATVVDLLHSHAWGEEEASGDDGRLSVVIDDDGPRLVVEPEAAPSDSLTVRRLIRGTGEQVTPGATVVVQYTLWTWSDGEVLDTTWTTGTPAVLDLGTAFPGVRSGLVDQFVGSRVLLEVPPEEGIGTDTIVMVADILAAG